MPPVFRWFFLCTKIEKMDESLLKRKLPYLVICPPPPKNFFLFLRLIFKLFFVLLFLDFGDFLLKAAQLEWEKQVRIDF